MPTQKLTDSFIRHHDNPDKRVEIYDELVGGLAVRITSTGYKSFIYRYRFGGRVRTYTIGSFSIWSLAEARERARELRKKVGRGIDPMEEKKTRKAKPQAKTFKELAEGFKSYHLPGLRESTKNEYERIIDNELIPALGKIAAKEVDQEQIIELLDKKAIKGESPTMANRIRARLHKIYEFGIGRRIVEVNPVTSVPRYSEGENKRERFYSENEIRELWKAFNMQTEPSRSVFKMLLITAQRSRETRYMHTKDLTINLFDNNTWTIPSELSKSKRSHDIPLTGMALDIIEQRQKEIESGYIFESRDGTPIQSLKRPKESVRKISGVKDFRPHDLRRTAATYMAKLGVDRTTLGKVLNHKGLAGDSQVTAIYDRHSYMDEKKAALERWALAIRVILAGIPVKDTIEIESMINELNKMAEKRLTILENGKTSIHKIA